MWLRLTTEERETIVAALRDREYALSAFYDGEPQALADAALCRKVLASLQSPALAQVELEPRWGDFPWSNFAALMPLTMGGDIHFQWYYYENMPWWGERNYNHTTGKWGADRVINAIPLSAIFDLRTQLRQRPAATAGPLSEEEPSA